MIPIILERDHKSKIEPLDKKKYLSGPKYTFFQFMETTKKLFANKIKKSEALCFYIAGKVIENGGSSPITQKNRSATSTRCTETKTAFCISTMALSSLSDDGLCAFVSLIEQSIIIKSTGLV